VIHAAQFKNEELLFAGLSFGLGLLNAISLGGKPK
jgi:hypothetical protein